jgi:hypothetical protein
MVSSMLANCDNLNNVRRRIRHLSGLLFPLPEYPGTVEVQSPLGQFALPHQFQPKLTLGEAVVSVFLALIRIFAGSMLFAAWGAFSFLAWTAISNFLGRTLVLTMLLAVFLVALGALMIGINVMGRMILNKPRRASV